MASVDTFTLNGESYQATVRCGTCKVVSKSQKCSACKSYHDSLQAMYICWRKRRSDDMSDTSSHSNERYLNTPEKKQKFLSSGPT